jgi:predicted AAA+ superfamily ATPase
MRYIPRYFQPPKESFFLFGPRGTGKTTLLKNQFPDALWVDLLEPDMFRKYSAFPEQLRDLIDANPGKTVLIIDEIQKIPELLPLVHALIEEKKEMQFILTGSSARKLKRFGVDLLAGKARLFHLHPFLPSELGESFSLEKSLEIGMLPLAWSSDDPEKTLASHISLYLKDEVQAESFVKKVGAFSRFLEVVSFSHASILNSMNIARESEINRSTIDNYLQILKDLSLGYTLDIFTKRAKRELSSHPKFYFFDSGFYRSLRPKGPLENPYVIPGSSLEGLVAESLRTWMDFAKTPYTLHFWRTRSGNEVDFIVYGQEGFFAIEVKNSSSISPHDLNGLKAFKEEYPESFPLLLYRGKEKVLCQQILCVPVEEFLRNLKPGNPLWEK